ncbi:MAG TPA: hypothetical protein VMM36_06070 [Opitutaceae bacterium]|nr:hypothetical protein [Opitutaceae bacterium]
MAAPILALALLAAPLARAAEVQRHGYVWETWIADTFFGGYRQSDYTQQWDIPAKANTAHGGIPANPKFMKHGTPVDLGDALRQFDIDEPFLLIVGYWRQEGNQKRIVNVVAVRVEPAQWRSLWCDITRADLERLDAAIKERSIDHLEARRRAQAIKNAPPFTTAVITVNPKIDSRSQRRLQCSISFDKVFTHLAPDASRDATDSPQFWGVRVPAPFYSPPRSADSSPD